MKNIKGFALIAIGLGVAGCNIVLGLDKFVDAPPGGTGGTGGLRRPRRAQTL